MTLIEVGGWLFWIAVCAIIAWDIFWLENDSGTGVTSGTIIGGFVLWFASGANNPFPWLAMHWGAILMCIIFYLFMGAAWGICKWWFFLHNKADDYEAQREKRQAEYQHLTKEDGTRTPITETYKEWLASTYHFPPSPADHKADITMWMVWWPLSGAWTMLNDPLKRVYRFIYQHLAETYSAIAARVFAGRFTELK